MFLSKQSGLVCNDHVLAANGNGSETDPDIVHDALRPLLSAQWKCRLYLPEPSVAHIML
jgi:hypothetical protein